MTRWQIAVVLVAALLLVGAAGAAKPVKEPVDRIVLIHYKDGVAARPAPVMDAASFKLLGVKWKAFPVRYLIDPSNRDGLMENSVATSVEASFATWDGATSKNLFSNAGRWTGPNPDPTVPDYTNVVYWGSMGDPKIIAMTTIWYTRGTKELVDTDIQMNDDMRWGIDVSTAFDIQNIATHEAGHVCGLADLYGPRDTELTMYGYGSPGETKKRSLAPGDEAGLRKLYGA
jgi:hypothetical protein